jgi:hypothetical protein
MTLTLARARLTYPIAWQSIEQQIADVRATGADLVPLEANVIEVKGALTLEVMALADFVVADDEDAPASAMRFRAPIETAQPLKLVPRG